jgi:eukaryotic-like serine/threonine-protein kinase
MQNQNTFSWINNSFTDLTNLNPLAQGGQKLVFSAEHPTDGDVVLKIIHPFQDPEVVRREILAVQRVGAARVPRILDIGQVDTPMGRCIWIREQRIIGMTLRERLQSGQLSTDELFRFGMQTLESLVDAEKAHIVHRDVKPENIMVDQYGDYWLLDFGISRHLSMSPLTPLTSAFGKFTLGYAPPEQLRNIQTEIDARADLFAYGVTFYECATGIQPFRDGAANEFEVLRRVENDTLPPLLVPCKASRSLSDLINAMTQKRRDHRPATVSEALLWLQEVVKAEASP